MDLKNGQKQGRDERMQVDYPTSTKIHTPDHGFLTSLLHLAHPERQRYTLFLLWTDTTTLVPLPRTILARALTLPLLILLS